MKGNLCIIPARGGSKRIKGKNIREFLGKPIIAYSIEAALRSGLFEEVIVSTDDVEIAAVATKYGASLPFSRTSETSDDHATLSDVVEEVRAHYAEKGVLFTNICCLLATAPFISKDLLERGLEHLKQTGADSVRPIVEFPYPIQRAYLMEEDGRVNLMNPEYSKTRSQDLTKSYHDAGMFYWMKGDKGLLGKNRYGIVISQYMAQDIDNEEDWRLAELKYTALNLTKLK